MTEFNLLVGGPPAMWPAELAQQTAVPWITADRGALRLLELGITPQVAVGDFDSLSTTELKRVQTQVADIRYAVADKDETDTELALNLHITVERLHNIKSQESDATTEEAAALNHFIGVN